MPRRPPIAARALVLTALALALVGTWTPAALAHDQLVATTPSADATVPAPPAEVQLELSAPAQALGTEVVVTGPDGAVVSQGPGQLRGSTVVQPLSGDPVGGAYTVAWRVTSADGHPLSGTFAFTVAGSPEAGSAAAPAGPATGAAPDAVAPDAVAPDGVAAARPAGSSGSGWVAAGAAAVVVVAAGVVLLRLRGRAGTR